ncbi:MAG: FG-GAP repeat protein, partial [Clostridia bacterium]|nr:FG-GAP repeat protein [Clostridia bacterium]
MYAPLFAVAGYRPVLSAIAVGDLNGDGYDEVVFACGWNGSSWIPNNMIFYGSPEGISNRYYTNLVATRGR